MTRVAMTKTKRSRTRGVTVQSVLAALALIGCFVYPLSLAMRTTGKRIAEESERGHEVMLEQAR
jgi:hypothetical protein